MLATFVPRMRNNNLEIRIAGSSCRPHLRNRSSDYNRNSKHLFRSLFRYSPISYLVVFFSLLLVTVCHFGYTIAQNAGRLSTLVAPISNLPSSVHGVTNIPITAPFYSWASKAQLGPKSFSPQIRSVGPI